MKNHKKLQHLFAGIVLFFGALALLVYLTDPFFHYHAPWFGLKAVEDEKEYQVPGMLKNFSYDSVLAGSSTVMSINTDTLNQRFSCRTVKAVGGSAAAPLLVQYLDMAFESHEIRYVFYGLDVFSFYHKPDMQVISEDVEFLINKNPLDDVKYIWNLDIIAEKIPNMIKKSQDDSYTQGLMYQLNDGAQTGMEAVCAKHRPKAGKAFESKPVTYQGAYVTENIKRLAKRVEEHPDTEFLFFIPPYHIIWWDDAYEKGLLDAYLYTLACCMEQLLPYENVRFYKTAFNEAETITDVYLYMDYIHGSTVVTGQLAQQIGASEDEITLASYQEELEGLREIFHVFRARVDEEGCEFLQEGAMSVQEGAAEEQIIKQEGK